MPQKKTPYFELRSGSVDTLLFSVKTTDLDALSKELTRRFEATPEFFANDVVAIDLRRLEAGQRIEMGALVALLERVRMRPVGIVAHEAQREWAGAGSLPLVESRDRRGAKEAEAASRADARAEAGVQAELAIGSPAARNGEQRAGDTAEAGVGNGLGMSGASRISSESGISPAGPAFAADTAASAGADGAQIVRPTLVIDKPLRSGQQVYSKGDLVVLGLVSYGAEVIAEGNIHIYAPLRGRALAGVHGNHGARIFCTCLEPELISIAGIYRTTDTPLADDVRGKPVQVRLDHEKLLFEPLRLN
ncbi:septum site-determining protein MinC [Pararobbsia alpina]|uniref:Probable septum site-determining protein MinC n=1 Tax=Pararobbsia alpina TaxID=621374 RepID=A0A6S7ASS4_9BURK|nr:septum site-determining protein MinC [Pararobbsia alpina]CAB3775888.1 septum site-determining protein MinC [Pararobbsia alpina]